MPKRATIAEVLDFANAVRKAGGGNPLDALMPAVPEDPTQCLIARNLNFNCEVNGAPGSFAKGAWAMSVDDPEVAAKIAQALDLKGGEYHVVLPAAIGQVAADFDATESILNSVLFDAEEDLNKSNNYYTTDGEFWLDVTHDDLTAEQRAYVDRRFKFHMRRLPIRQRRLIRDMVPYIEYASDEAKRLATFVNADGTIVR